MTHRLVLLALLLALAACGSDQPTASQQDSPTVDSPAAADSTKQVDANEDVTERLPEDIAAEAAPPPPPPEPQKSVKIRPSPAATLPPASRRTPEPKPSSGSIPSDFSDVVALDRSILLDIRYATANNFTKAKIYDCAHCLLRPEAAQAILKAHKALQKKGLGLKMFDCYRPRPYQQRLWDKVPNPDYVTPPAKGSMHSRGAAVDLTIVDAKGRELDMGTEYDFFGEKAHTDYRGHSAKVQANRDLLRETLAAVGFKGIRTEWWHFSFQGKDYPLSDYVWPCQ